MSSIFTTLRSVSKARLLIGILLFGLLLALRLPWLQTNGGNDGMWAYGFFTTDEGLYTNGGRMAYLTGKFFDPELTEPATIKTAFGMHLLSYISYSVFGLGFGTTRIPSILFSAFGWLAIYYMGSRTTRPLLAAFVTFILSCNPVSLTYERMASTDVIVGSIIAISCALISKRENRYLAMAGMLLGLGLSVKASILGFFPLICLFSVCHLKGEKKKHITLLGFVLLTAGAIKVYYALKVSPLIATLPPAFAKRIESSNEFLTFDYKSIVAALASFPRGFAICQTGPLLIWLMVLPSIYILTFHHRTRKWLNPRTALCLGVLIYLASLASQPRSPIRYYLPLFYFLPLFLLYFRRVIYNVAPTSHWNTVSFLSAGVIHILLFQMICVRLFTNVTLNEYSLPQVKTAGIYLVIKAVDLFIVYFFISRLFKIPNKWFFLVFLGILFESYFSGGDYASMKYISPFIEARLVLQLAMLFSFFLWFRGLPFRNWKVWFGWNFAIFASFWVAVFTWKSAAKEIIQQDFTKMDFSLKVSADLEPDAILIGRSSSTVFRQTNHRIGLTLAMGKPEEFIAAINEQFRKNSNVPIYWIVESSLDSLETCVDLMDKAGIDVDERFVYEEPTSFSSQWSYELMHFIKLTKKPAGANTSLKPKVSMITSF